MKHADTTNMVGVFMGKNDGVAVADIVAKISQPRLGVASANACVEEHLRVAAPDEHAITSTS